MELTFTIFVIYHIIIINTVMNCKSQERLLSHRMAKFYLVIAYLAIFLGSAIMFFELKRGLPIMFFGGSLMMFVGAAEKISKVVKIQDT